MNNKKKILHILNTSTYSGAENVVCQIITMFKNDCDIEMIYCSPNGAIADVLAERNIAYSPVNLLNKRELSKVIDHYRPDVIHAHDIRASVLAALCHKRIKLICTIHGNDTKMRTFCAKSISTLIFIKEASHIFWVSKSCLEDFFFKKIAMKKSSILYNVIDKNEIYERARQDRNCYEYDAIFLGRLSHPKNPEKLLDVIKIACHAKKNLKVAIVGTGVFENRIRERIKNENLKHHVYMLGFIPNPMKILSCSKVMLLASDYEGTPMCVLEAMALGVPVVSTPTDGVKDLIDNDITGFLSSDTNKLAEKFIEYVSDSNLRERLSKNIVEKFDTVNNLHEYKAILKKQYGD